MTPSKKLKAQYFLGGKYSDIHLTLQEARCMICFLKGMTHQQTAQKLKLSLGTVSSYSENMKRKLNFYSKKEMVKFISQTDFVQYLRNPEVLEKTKICRLLI